MDQGPFKNAWIIMLAAVLMVGAYPFLYQLSPWLQVHTRTFQVLPLFSQPLAVLDSLPVSVQSLAILPDSSLQDTTMEVEQTLEEEAPISEELIPLSDYQGVEHLAAFFKTLHEREEQVRVAYYGDSSIEGDLICMTFRDSMQRRFGGSGVGFVPIMSKNPGFRRSIYQAASNNWYRNMIGGSNNKRLQRGISGEYFTAMGARVLPDSVHTDSLPPLDPYHWATFKGSKYFGTTRRFSQVRLFYGRPPLIDSSSVAKGSLLIKANGDNKKFTLEAGNLINELTVVDTLCERVRMTFQVAPNFPLYGVSVESRQGFIVDNFPARGSDGGALRTISKIALNDFQEYLDYDLIVFQFGLNVMNPRLKDYSWYQTKMEQLIRHYQEAMPGVPILVIGISDRGTKINGSMKTDPSVPRITEAQRAAARNCGVAFFSLYEAMGGEGTMVNWVEKHRPRLANKDYTHFNFKGAEKVSNLLIDYLMSHYMQFVANGGVLEI